MGTCSVWINGTDPSFKEVRCMKGIFSFLDLPGRSRLEPVAIIILSVIMSLASLEVMISSVRKMIAFGQKMEGIAEFELVTLLMAGSVVGKCCSFSHCMTVDSSKILVLSSVILSCIKIFLGGDFHSLH